MVVSAMTVVCNFLIKVDFPITLESKIRWSSVVYNADGSVKPRVFTEIISVTLVKSRC